MDERTVRPLAARKINRADIFFFAAFIAAAVMLTLGLPNGMGGMDEGFYFTIPHRLLLGDRFLIDDWSRMQLAAIFQYLPFRLFYRLSGGTDGVQLFFRYLWLAVILIFCVYIYVSLRRYGVWAALGALLFAGFRPSGYMTLNYYSMSVMAVLLAGMLALAKRRAGRWDFLFAGFVFACAVIIQPPAAVLYALFSGLTLLRWICGKKRRSFLAEYAFVLNPQAWLFATAGVCLCAAAFCVILLAGGDVGGLFAGLRELTATADYTLRGMTMFFFGKIRDCLANTGAVFPILQCVSLPLVLLTRRKAASRPAIWFALSGALFALTMAATYLRAGFWLSIVRPAPLCLFGLSCYMISEKKDRRMLALLLWGVGFSFCMDMTSSISLGIGAAVSIVPSVVLIGNLATEIRARLRADVSAPKVAVRLQGALYGLCLAAVAACFCFEFSLDYLSVATDRKAGAITVGPLRGISVEAEEKAIYDATVRDLDVVKTLTDGRFYVADCYPWTYLYADLPYATCSAYEPEDSNYDPAYIRHYWEARPENRPTCIYIPMFEGTRYERRVSSAQRLGDMLSLCKRYEVINGEAGYIVKVLAWK